MAGPAVSIGCAVLLTPGAAGPPDSGFISVITQTAVTANGVPLATVGSICQMINSVSGVPYVLPIGRRRLHLVDDRRHGAGAGGRSDSVRTGRADDHRAAGRSQRHRPGSAVMARLDLMGADLKLDYAIGGGFFEDADLATAPGQRVPRLRDL